MSGNTGGMWFQSDDEAERWRWEFFLKLDPAFYIRGISKLVSHYDQCLNVDGNYVEK